MVDFAAMRERLKRKHDALTEKALREPVTREEYDGAFVNPPYRFSWTVGANFEWWSLKRPEIGGTSAAYKSSEHNERFPECRIPSTSQ